MGFRDDHLAAWARADAAERALAEAQTEIARLRQLAPAKARAPGATGKTPERVAVVLGLLLGGAAYASGWGIGGYYGEQAGIVLGIAACLALCVAAVLVGLRRLVYVASPLEAVVLSGRRHRQPDGTILGYRVVTAARVLRLPLIERADILDLSPITIELSLPELACTGAATVRIAREPGRLIRAVERFLGQPREVVHEAAREAITAALRAVMAREAAAAGDPLRLAEAVRVQVEGDFGRLGLELETIRFSPAARVD